MYDGIEYRGFAQEIVEDLGANAGVPVWNGLTQARIVREVVDITGVVLTKLDGTAKGGTPSSSCTWKTMPPDFLVQRVPLVISSWKKVPAPWH